MTHDTVLKDGVYLNFFYVFFSLLNERIIWRQGPQEPWQARHDERDAGRRGRAARGGTELRPGVRGGGTARGVDHKEDEQYPVSSGLLIATNTIWSAMANYTMKKSAPPNLDEPQFPEASVHYDAEQKVVPGHLAEVEVWVETKIQTITTLIVEVEGMSKDISLCGLKVKSFGRNLPCVDMDTEPFYHPPRKPSRWKQDSWTEIFCHL
ncbi:uncharacterized protein CEXT_438681 [Caerostris extrusa]|uniref:Uncharacterized protein n=1 Tax=Caerostris extrusa TaxID=172846 RepID=A0AAV4X0X3_CAEEX|nr:uncharacterized protein CEXT_438681 [Caerostris extrusa]